MTNLETPTKTPTENPKLPPNSTKTPTEKPKKGKTPTKTPTNSHPMENSFHRAFFIPTFVVPIR